MCVDLRPLNQRIYQQKYPFPIIDDQLDKLYDKKYFIKLDLKDGFHQIAIHPDHTKYFAFATQRAIRIFKVTFWLFGSANGIPKTHTKHIPGPNTRRQSFSVHR